MTNALAPSDLFPPPQAPLSLHVGEVMHQRMKPFGHRFAYRVFTLLVDLTDLGAAARVSPFFSVNRFNLLALRERDHGPRDGSPLADHVRRLLKEAGCDIGAGRILLLCYPRVFGFVFNPLAVYFCYDAQDRLAALVYEVRNTFGEMHSYVAPLREGEASVAGVRQERDKIFYVSPFLDMPMRYRFRILPPGERVLLRILEEDATGPILAATYSGERREASGFALLRHAFAVPFLTLKVVAAIHWEALKLWLKGARLHDRPAPPPPASDGAAGPIAGRNASISKG